MATSAAKKTTAAQKAAATPAKTTAATAKADAAAEAEAAAAASDQATPNADVSNVDLGGNPEADARAENSTPPDNGTVNVAGHQPYAPVAAPLDRPRNPVYTPENIDPETQVSRDDHEPVHAAPSAVRDNSRLVDEKGDAVAISDVFDDAKGPQNFRTVQTRVFVEEPLAGSANHTTRRLLFPVGARVNVDTVARLTREWA